MFVQLAVDMLVRLQATTTPFLSALLDHGLIVHTQSLLSTGSNELGRIRLQRQYSPFSCRTERLSRYAERLLLWYGVAGPRGNPAVRWIRAWKQ